jgi:FKBP-type peptidyl-prolyl cis-trans isomerase (trigger factor)
VKSNTIKKICICGIVVFAFAVLTVSLMVVNNTNSSATDSEIQLHPIVEEMLQYLSIENCVVTELANYEDLSIYLKTPRVTDEEVNEYIDQILIGSGQESLSEDFVQERYDVDSIDEFYSYTHSDLLDTKKVELIIDARKKIISQLISGSAFRLDNEVVANYAIETVQFYEMDAANYDLSFDEYMIQEFGGKEQFFDFCYNKTEYLVKTYLLIGAVAQQEGSYTNFDNINNYSEYEIYDCYQSLESEFYDLFLAADKDF